MQTYVRRELIRESRCCVQTTFLLVGLRDVAASTAQLSYELSLSSLAAARGDELVVNRELDEQAFECGAGNFGGRCVAGSGSWRGSVAGPVVWSFPGGSARVRPRVVYHSFVQVTI